MRKAVLLLVLGFAVSGCTITEITRVDTGLFDGDLKKLSDAYETVDKMDRGKTSKAKIESETGLRFNAPNVERVPGPAAFRRIFDNAVFQSALSDPANAPKLLNEMQPYTAYFIPFRNVTTYTDRWYFSRKDVERLGDDLSIIVMFKDDMLFYCDYRYVQIKTKESYHAFGQGLIDILKEFLGPTDALYDLVEKVKDRDKEEE